MANRIRRSLEERFWAKVNKDGPLPDYAPHLGSCWLWTGAVTRNGYGQIGSGGKRGPVLYAHRVSYELVHGPLPDDRTRHIDHLCRVPRCVNPVHLEWVPVSVNVMRGVGPAAVRAMQQAITHCPYDHEYTPENTRINRAGARECRACARARWHARKAAAA